MGIRTERHKARELATDTLYSLDFNSNLPPMGDWDLFQGLSEDEEAALTEDTKIYASFLITGTLEHLEEIDSIISKYSKNRPIDKIDAVDRNILRISFFQLLYDKETHPTIVIDEAVKLSQELSNDVSFKFINGILDTYSKEKKMIQLKDDYQISKIRSSCHLLSDMFDEVGPQIVEGISTYDIDRLCESFMKKHHAKGPCKGYFGYPNVTCTSVNDTVIHGIPNKKEILKNGDIISLDVCIDLDGYISDSTHSYEIGVVSDKVHTLNVETRKSLYLGIEAASKPNARIQDIAQAISSHCRKFKYGVVKDYCGHGVGLDIHEDPEVPNYVSLANPNPRIRKGMVFAIEPMINMGTWRVEILNDNWTVKTLDRLPACHWEHTVAITEDGLEILTEY